MDQEEWAALAKSFVRKVRVQAGPDEDFADGLTYVIEVFQAALEEAQDETSGWVDNDSDADRLEEDDLEDMA